MTGVYLFGAAVLSVALVWLDRSMWSHWTRPLGYIGVGFLLGLAVCAGGAVSQ